MTKVGLKREQFDLVVSSEVLEHIPGYEKLLREAWRVLEPGGTFIATVPNNELIVSFTCPHCLKKIYRNDHINQFDRARLTSDLKQAGFEIERAVVLRSKILNQFQYHLKLKYGPFIKFIDRILSGLFPKYTFYLLVIARKPSA